MNGKKRSQRIERWNLSPKQATALRKIARHPWTIDDARMLLQTTVGALYKREFIEVNGNFFRITEQGRKALDLQAHSEIERSATTISHGGFAAVIRELAGYAARPDHREPTRPARPHLVARSA